MKIFVSFLLTQPVAITPEGEFLYALGGRLFKIRLTDNEVFDLTGERVLGGLSAAINPIDYAQ